MDALPSCALQRGTLGENLSRPVEPQLTLIRWVRPINLKHVPQAGGTLRRAASIKD